MWPLIRLVLSCISLGAFLRCAGRAHSGVHSSPGRQSEMTLTDVIGTPREEVFLMNPSPKGSSQQAQGVVSPGGENSGTGNHGNHAHPSPESSSPVITSHGSLQGSNPEPSERRIHVRHAVAPDIATPEVTSARTQMRRNPSSTGQQNAGRRSSSRASPSGTAGNTGSGSSRLDVLHNPNRFLAENQRRINAGLPRFNFTGLTIDAIESMLFGKFAAAPGRSPATSDTSNGSNADLAILANALSSLSTSQSNATASASPSASSSGRTNGAANPSGGMRSMNGATGGTRSMNGATGGTRSMNGATGGTRSMNGATGGTRSLNGATGGTGSMNGATGGTRSMNGATGGTRSMNGATGGTRSMNGATGGLREFRVDWSILTGALANPASPPATTARQTSGSSHRENGNAAGGQELPQGPPGRHVGHASPGNSNAQAQPHSHDQEPLSSISDAISVALQQLNESPSSQGNQGTSSQHQNHVPLHTGSLGNTLLTSANAGGSGGDVTGASANGGAGSLSDDVLSRLGAALDAPLGPARGRAESQVAMETVQGVAHSASSVVADLRREFAQERQRDAQLLQLVSALSSRLLNNAPPENHPAASHAFPPSPPAPGPSHNHGSSGSSGNDELLRHIHRDIEDMRLRVSQLEADLRKISTEKISHKLELERLTSRVQKNELSLGYLNDTQHSLSEELTRGRDSRVNIWRRMSEVQRNLTLTEMAMKHMEVDFSLSLLVLGGNMTFLESNLTTINSSLSGQLHYVTDTLRGLQVNHSHTTTVLRNLSASNTDQVRQLSELKDQRCETGDEKIIQFPFDSRMWPVKRQVFFSRAFVRSPFVHVGIGGIQAQRGYNLAIICSAGPASASGFEITCETNTSIARVYGVDITWLACLL